MASCLVSGENLRLQSAHQWPLEARRVKKRDIGYVSLPSSSKRSIDRETSANIAAIDFGSTYCSIAYTTSAAGDDINSLRLNEVHPRVPTAILLKKHDEEVDGTTSVGVKCTVDSFGLDAQTRYQRLKQKDRPNHIYFERMKMRLQHDQEVHRSMKLPSDISDSSNKEWYLIEVIAFIIKYLKDELFKHLSMAGNSMSASDFDWVITVPAIWQARGKQMMREAGYLAGLCGGDGISYLSYTSSGVQYCPLSDISKSKLSLVPEPEAAAIYCQAMKPQNFAQFCKKVDGSHTSHQQYVVIDIGGGTVDITAQEVNPETGEVNVVLAPQGNDCGGMKVNREFAHIMQRILGERQTDSLFDLETSFPKLLQQNSALKSSLNYFLYHDFESQKEMFGRDDSSDTNKEVSVKIPDKISSACSIRVIEQNVSQLKDPQIELEDDCIYIKPSKMNDIFRPAIQGILKCTEKAFNDLIKKGYNINTIYLVGGFGGCKYVYNCIDNLLKTKFPSLKYSLIVPEDHKLAVAHGAVLYRKKSVISSRCWNRTYGIAVSVDYDPSQHSKQHFKFNEDGDKICDDAFLTFLRSGDTISTNEVVIDEILPNIDQEKVISIPFYSSEETYLEYLTDRIPRNAPTPLATKVGELRFEIPEGDILHKDQRQFRVILDFSSAEITATVRYLITNTDVNTELDFLA